MTISFIGFVIGRRTILHFEANGQHKSDIGEQEEIFKTQFGKSHQVG